MFLTESARMDEVERQLASDGPLAGALPGYEERPGQLQMAHAVARVLDQGGVLAIEAGTGTGKSLAYLVPAILWSRRTGEKVVVSTATINLQEQLLRKDLPVLAARLGLSFRAVLVKGRRNYICLAKRNEILRQPSLFPDEVREAETRVILDWCEETADGSLADLDFVPNPDVWEPLTADHDDCLRSRCPEYDRCFFYRARREAAEADILVVNHHLLLADRALRAESGAEPGSGVLPEAGRLVLDEAHHLEEVATAAFSTRVSRRRIERLLGRLEHPRDSGRGILPGLRERLLATDDDGAARLVAVRVDDILRPEVRRLRAAVAAAFGGFGGAAAPLLTAGVSEIRVTESVRRSSAWAKLAEQADCLARTLHDATRTLVSLGDLLDDLGEDTRDAVLFPAHQLLTLGRRLGGVATDLERFVDTSPGLCRSIGRTGRSGDLTLALAPVEPGGPLSQLVFGPPGGAVLTSATLSVDGRFDFFLTRSGLDRLPREQVETVRIESPFFFDDQAVLAIPEDIPGPDEAGYEPALHEGMARSVEASEGGAFLLFTSYAALERAHAELAGRFEERGLSVFRQGELGRHELLRRFAATDDAVLFATDSFWEGVDVRGERLRLVVVARLPFRVPSDPVQEARYEAIAESGGNPFSEYAVPQAVIRLRQGFGRLIRSRDDTGAVVLLDSRIFRRRYGEAFLNSLPPARRLRGPAERVYRELEEFFARQPRSDRRVRAIRIP